MATSKYDRIPRPDDDISDDEFDEKAARTSEDVRRHDQETLTTEEEAERLLGGGGGEERSKRGDGEGKTSRRRRRRESGRRQATGEKRELMYEMEEGGRRSSSAESSGHSSESDMQRLGEVQARQKKSRAGRCLKFTAIHLVIIVAFLALLFGAYSVSSHSKSTRPSETIAKTLSNGTHTFLPTTLLISLDGFRADFLTRGLTPTLNSFIRSGVSPKYMRPAFPSLTFPNHFTLVTGLHPESHGIVGNTFWDPNTEKEFYYTDPDRSMQPEWWNAEPIWETAEQAGLRTAIHMWPGSEAHIGNIEPEYVDAFNHDEELDRKVQRIFQWLDLPGTKDKGSNGKVTRPQLIAAYVPNVDTDGHKFGPNSTDIRSTIAEVDGMLGAIFKGVDERNLSSILNIIVVSDHGMATTSTNRLVQLEDLVDTKLIEHIDGWPLYGLRPYDSSPSHLHSLYKELKAKSKQKKYRNAFDVYLRDKNMPKKYHFACNPRIAPLWIVPRAGWAIVTHDDFNVAHAKKQGDIYHPRGLHGYDHEHPLMRAIFVARGPAFPHPSGSRVKNFQNTEVYNIVCDSLGLEPKPNNGTLHLPFRTKGKHDFSIIPDIPFDPPADYGDGKIDIGKVLLPPDIPVQPEPPTKPKKPERPERPVVHDGKEGGEPKGMQEWWVWMKSKVESIRWWVSVHLGKDKKGGEEKEKSKGEAKGKGKGGGAKGKDGKGTKHRNGD